MSDIIYPLNTISPLLVELLKWGEYEKAKELIEKYEEYQNQFEKIGNNLDDFVYETKEHLEKIKPMTISLKKVLNKDE